ncbi:putative glycerophosphoryl diester phosphodiesterase 1 [Pseudovibrio axinellae]|uniref:glycerophosphodiester phosphodiesterase n=1 Tax=Pseudovibrio axinellae TaxID=989403 RepID=A0A165YF28_9HYPH|nr:glycerophosphodiester phosphodiesterase family protein [Pseudovibrio axinellae]KZL18788.1 putative glycerophosphoryl diester phosphodiesterase 1 [Pseudovibrio axinellae]SEP92785.1 glycerophosphoryl diester phosphodiesterase [Pseudovibrio axinellae]
MHFVRNLTLGLMAGACMTVGAQAAQVGPRPAFLVEQMQDGPLKEKLRACIGNPAESSSFSIGHRGAPMQFPEHTLQSYQAAALMGAGVQECDVTFTKDKELVCRHSQNDMATTTNILTSDLADTCVKPFTPAANGEKASAECRTSDITLAEFESLHGKMDASDPTATTVEGFLKGTPDWRTDLYAGAGAGGTLMTHAQSIELFKAQGVKFTPELKQPSVEMPFDGFTQEDYAQKLINEYKAAGVPASDVFAQSFSLDDVLYWIKAEPEFGKQAVFLDGRYNDESFDASNPSTFKPSMAELKAMGVNYIAPPLWVLVTLEDGKIVPSAYAKAAKAADLNIITWTLERSGLLSHNKGGWYYNSISDAVTNEGTALEVLDVLAQDVKVTGVFSDWPATVTFYANCMGLK